MAAAAKYYYDQTTGDVIDTTTGEVVKHDTKTNCSYVMHFRKSSIALDKLMDDTTYDPRERQLMAYMCRHASKNNLVKMNLKRLLATDDALREIATSKTTITKYLSLLEIHGFIKCTNPDAKGTAREYMVNPDYSGKASSNYMSGYLYSQWCAIQPSETAPENKIRVLEDHIRQAQRQIDKLQKMVQREQLQLENMRGHDEKTGAG